jgi:hypothetical protein
MVVPSGLQKVLIQMLSESPTINIITTVIYNRALANTALLRANSSTGHLWYCVHPGCTHVSKRQFDLSRHIQNRHNIGNERHDCPGKNCHRVGDSGFKRKDHLTEHLRKVHMKPIPKTGSGGGKSRSSR